MTATIVVPDHLITTAEWDALDREPYLHYELSEGVLVMTPRPEPRHQHTARALVDLLDRQLPDDFITLLDVEIAVQVAEPATYRAPNIIVVPSRVLEQNPPRVGAHDVILAVEVVSPNTVVADKVTKAAEYAAAGIPAYLVVDRVSNQPEVTIYRQTGSGSYEARPVPWNEVTIELAHIGTVTVDLTTLR